MIRTALAVGGVVLAGVAVMAGLSAWRARSPVNPELVRKLLHVWIGMLALTFPWLFDSPWPVLCVVGVGGLILFGLKVSRQVQRWLGGVLDGVARPTRGDVYFLVSAALLFVLSGGDPLLFGVPILFLTFADTAAALVGVRWGRLAYGPAGRAKTVEGSLAFFSVALFCAFVPLVLLAGAGPGRALAIAVVLAFAATLFEAAAGDGLDNLTVPLGAFLVLGVLL